MIKKKFIDKHFEQKKQSKNLLGSSGDKFYQYLFYRNKFTLLGRIFSRLILALEFYFLYTFFHVELFVGFTSVAITLFYLKIIFDGFIQNHRVNISLNAHSSNSPRNIIEIQHCIIFSLLYSGAISTLILALTATVIDDWAIRLFILARVATLPLQYSVNVLWTSLYTSRRAKLNFYALILFRAIPLLCLITTYSIIGFYSFIFGTVLGILLENIYLTLTAIRYLRANPFLGLLQRVSDFRLNNYWKFNTFSIGNIAYGTYNIGLLLGCLVHSNIHWETHTIFLCLLIILSYPSLRIAQSISMDIFLALGNRNLQVARQFVKNTAILGTILTIIIVSATLIITLQFPNPYDTKGELLLEYLPYFIIFITGRILFEFNLKLLRASATDGKTGLLLLNGILLILLPLQCYLLLYWRANLSLIYLVDFCYFLILISYWQFKSNLQFSPFYQNAIGQLKAIGITLPEVWISNLRKNIIHDPNTKIMLFIIHNYLNQQERQNEVIRLFSKNFAGSHVTILTSGVICAFGNNQITLGKKYIALHFSGYFRYIGEISLDNYNPNRLATEAAIIAKYKGLSKRNTKLFKALHNSFVESIYSRLESEIKENNNLTLADQLATIWQKLGLKGKVVLLNTNNFTNDYYDQETIEAIRALQFLRPQYLEIYLRYPNRFYVIQNLTSPLAIIDTIGCRSKEIQEIESAAIAYSVIISIQQMSK